MSKKVSELTKELDISLEELKGYADKMGIAIASARSSVEDMDAERLIRSINLMKGNTSSNSSSGNRPKIKAVPVMPKDGMKAKPPIGKPTIPKKAVVPKEEEEPAKAEEPAASDIKSEVEEKAEKPAEEPKTEPVKAAEPKEEEKPAKAEEPIEEPKAEPKKEEAPKKEAKKEVKEEPKKEEPEEYVNAPGKPMRFKKISDAATEKKKAEELSRKLRTQRRRVVEKKAASLLMLRTDLQGLRIQALLSRHHSHQARAKARARNFSITATVTNNRDMTEEKTVRADAGITIMPSMTRLLLKSRNAIKRNTNRR